MIKILGKQEKIRKDALEDTRGAMNQSNEFLHYYLEAIIYIHDSNSEVMDSFKSDEDTTHCAST